MQFYDEKSNTWIAHTATREYRLRRRQLVDWWLITGVILLVLPLGAQLAVALLATCLSFMYLDETTYHGTNGTLHQPRQGERER